MTVHVQREAGRGMTEQVLNALNIRSGCKGDRGAAMPEIMRPCVRPADTGGNALEMLIEIDEDQIAAELVCKDKIVFVVPILRSSETVFKLARPFIFQILKCNRWRRYCPCFSALCAGCNIVFAAFFLLDL